MKAKHLEMFPKEHPYKCRCKFCNRGLKSEKSVQQGYGDRCYKLYLEGYRGIQSTIYDFIKEK